MTCYTVMVIVFCAHIRSRTSYASPLLSTCKYKVTISAAGKPAAGATSNTSLNLWLNVRIDSTDGLKDRRVKPARKPSAVIVNYMVSTLQSASAVAKVPPACLNQASARPYSRPVTSPIRSSSFVRARALHCQSTTQQWYCIAATLLRCIGQPYRYTYIPSRPPLVWGYYHLLGCV